MLPTIRSQLLALVALTCIVLLVEHLIVTDAEAIEALAARAAKAAGERDFAALGRLLSDDFRYGTRDRAETLAHVESMLRKHPATGIEIDVYEIRVDDGHATAKGLVRAQVYGRPFGVHVDVELVETEDGWKLDRVQSAQRYAR